MAGVLLIPSMLATGLGCSSSDGPSGPPPPAPPSRVVSFKKVLERPAPPLPSGLAVSPDGRFLASLSFGDANIALYDAETLEIVSEPQHWVDSIQIVGPHGIAISPDSRMVVIAGWQSPMGLAIPGFERLFLVHAFPKTRHVVRDAEGANYYLSGDPHTLSKMTAEGEILETFPAQEVEGIALSDDEKSLFALTETGLRLLALRASDLKLERSVALPLSGAVVIPLRREQAGRGGLGWWQQDRRAIASHGDAGRRGYRRGRPDQRLRPR